MKLKYCETHEVQNGEYVWPGMETKIEFRK